MRALQRRRQLVVRPVRLLHGFGVAQHFLPRFLESLLAGGQGRVLTSKVIGETGLPLQRGRGLAETAALVRQLLDAVSGLQGVRREGLELLFELIDRLFELAEGGDRFLGRVQHRLYARCRAAEGRPATHGRGSGSAGRLRSLGAGSAEARPGGRRLLLLPGQGAVDVGRQLDEALLLASLLFALLRGLGKRGRGVACDLGLLPLFLLRAGLLVAHLGDGAFVALHVLRRPAVQRERVLQRTVELFLRLAEASRVDAHVFQLRARRLQATLGITQGSIQAGHLTACRLQLIGELLGRLVRVVELLRQGVEVFASTRQLFAETGDLLFLLRIAFQLARAVVERLHDREQLLLLGLQALERTLGKLVGFCYVLLVIGDFVQLVVELRNSFRAEVLRTYDQLNFVVSGHRL